MEKPYEVMLTRKGKYLWKRPRRFLSVATAIRRASFLAVDQGQPGDVVEISHAPTGMSCGTLRVGVRSLQAKWTVFSRGV